MKQLKSEDQCDPAEGAASKPWTRVSTPLTCSPGKLFKILLPGPLPQPQELLLWGWGLAISIFLPFTRDSEDQRGLRITVPGGGHRGTEHKPGSVLQWQLVRTRMSVYWSLAPKILMPTPLWPAQMPLTLLTFTFHGGFC